MLVLSRKKEQSIMIGDDIKVTVVKVRGDKVRLGFEAPAEIPIHREEIYRRIVEAQRSADHVATEDEVLTI